LPSLLFPRYDRNHNHNDYHNDYHNSYHNSPLKPASTSQCLGGMAQGPCGEDFKAAFSCFVHSDQEPKGVDCVEKFKAMQDCFRKHPDVYGEGQ